MKQSPVKLLQRLTYPKGKTRNTNKQNCCACCLGQFSNETKVLMVTIAFYPQMIVWGITAFGTLSHPAQYI